MARQTTKRTVRIARKLRREMTLPEVLLWQALKQSEVRFRKQHPCGPFVVDFYCAAAKLAIEVEGIVHDMGENPERDEARFEWLERQGYSVLRIPAQDVLKDVNGTAEAIVAACRERGA
jgi:very-short-patch-repair endonuclease